VQRQRATAVLPRWIRQVNVRTITVLHPEAPHGLVLCQARTTWRASGHSTPRVVTGARVKSPIGTFPQRMVRGRASGCAGSSGWR